MLRQTLRAGIMTALVVIIGASLATPAHADPVKPHRGEGIASMTARTCGAGTNWRDVAAANGITASTGWRVLYGKTYDVRCGVQPAARASRSTARVTSGWVHPLASGVHAVSCWGASRDNGKRSHKGVDIPTPKGTAVRSVAAGQIVANSSDTLGGYYVAVKHNDGTYTVYMHLREPGRPIGTVVAAGERIAWSGDTGNARGNPHLHFETHLALWSNRVNPAPFMRAHGVEVGC